MRTEGDMCCPQIVKTLIELGAIVSKGRRKTKSNLNKKVAWVICGVVGLFSAWGDRAAGQPIPCPGDIPGSECVCDTLASDITVCFDWEGSPNNPETPVDFIVDYRCVGCGDAPSVLLRTGSETWVIRSRLSDGSVADLGPVRAIDPQDFVVKFGTGFSDPGAANVGEITLEPSGLPGNPNYSTISGGAIRGDVNGSISVRENASGVGGVCNLFIEGDLNGNSKIASIGNLTIFGDLNGAIKAGRILAEGVLQFGDGFTYQGCPTGSQVNGAISIVTMGDESQIIVNGSMNAPLAVGTMEPGADIKLRGDLGDVRVDIGEMNDDPTGQATATIINVGTLGGPSTCQFEGDLAIDDAIHSDAYVQFFGEMVSTGSLDLKNHDVEGTIYIRDGGDGAILNGRTIVSAAVVTLGDGSGKPFDGSATFSSIASGGLLRTLNDSILNGTVTIDNDIDGLVDMDGGIDIAGRVLVAGDLNGTINSGGPLGGDVHVFGDVSTSGAVDIAGRLVRGRLMVDGFCDGTLSIGDTTGSTSLIQLLGGIGANSVLTINANETAGNAGGDIHVGAIEWTQMPDTVYDGCIEILDDGSGGGGDLTGDITVIGCHATADDLGITIEGTVSGRVTIGQAGCTNQVSWSDCP
jgi:hypothetical protein